MIKSLSQIVSNIETPEDWDKALQDYFNKLTLTMRAIKNSVALLKRLWKRYEQDPKQYYIVDRKVGLDFWESVAFYTDENKAQAHAQSLTIFNNDITQVIKIPSK